MKNVLVVLFALAGLVAEAQVPFTIAQSGCDCFDVVWARRRKSRVLEAKAKGRQDLRRACSIRASVAHSRKQRFQGDLWRRVKFGGWMFPRVRTSCLRFRRNGMVCDPL